MNTQIKHFFLAQFFFNLPLFAPISMLFLLEKGLTMQQILTITAIGLVAKTAAEIPLGVFADRFGKKITFIVGGVIYIAGTFLWLFADSFLSFALISIFFGIGIACFSGADIAFIYEELIAQRKEKTAQKIYSYYYTMLGLGYAIGAFLGGFLTSKHSLEAFYLTYKGTIFFSAFGLVLLFFLKERQPTKTSKKLEHKQESALLHFNKGVELLKANKSLQRLTMFSTLTFSFALFDLYQLYFQKAQIPDALFGYILGTSTIFITITKFYSYKIEEWVGARKGFIIIGVLPAILYAFMAITYNPVLAALLFILTDMAGNVRDPIIADYQNRYIPEKYHNQRATILSTLSLITSGYIAILLPVIGWLADKELSLAFSFCSIVMLCGMYFLPKEENTVIK